MSESKGKPLSGKVVLVTGGGRGIGRECALAAAEAGALVSVAATTYSEIEAVKDEINQLDCQALAVIANVTNKEDTKRMVQETVSALGGLDIAINAAGLGGRRGSLLDLDADMFRDLLMVNVLGVMLSCKAEIQEMLKQKGGHIINISSGLAHRAVPNAIGYSSTKWAVEGITQGIAVEFTNRGIIAHTLGPGRMLTKNFPLSELPKDRYHEARPLEAVRGSLMDLLTNPAGYSNGAFLNSVDWDREHGIEWESPLKDA